MNSSACSSHLRYQRLEYVSYVKTTMTKDTTAQEEGHEASAVKEAQDRKWKFKTWLQERLCILDSKFVCVNGFVQLINISNLSHPTCCPTSLTDYLVSAEMNEITIQMNAFAKDCRKITAFLESLDDCSGMLFMDVGQGWAKLFTIREKMPSLLEKSQNKSSLCLLNHLESNRSLIISLAIEMSKLIFAHPDL